MSAPEFATLTSDDLVTGEAVALDLPPASLGLRIASGLIDVLVTVGLLLTVLLVSTLATIQTDEALLSVAYLGTIITVFLVFPTTVETLTRGRSLGKLAVGLRTVREDGGPISFQHAFVRALIGFVEIYALSGAPAFFSMLLSSKGKRLGDYAAGTYVVRVRVRLQLTPPLPMPPHLATWARTADLTSLPTGLSLAIRQYLGRRQAIDLRAGSEIGLRLAEQARPHVAPAPPAGTTPDDFLAAVIAGRRERDLARLRRESELRRRLTARP